MQDNIIQELKKHVADFDFAAVFRVLGWDLGKPNEKASLGGFELSVVAKMSVVPVFVCVLPEIPGAEERKAVAAAVGAVHCENVLIFVDAAPSQAVWRWHKDEKTAREHFYFRGQPGDLFVAKIAGLAFDFDDFEAGRTAVSDVTRRIRAALDVESVTKKFFENYKEQRLQFASLIGGVERDDDRKHYATLLLNRLMFVWFLQKKGFLDGGNVDYLPQKLVESRRLFGENHYYRNVLCPLFFEALARPENRRSPQTRILLGRVPYLNGGIFLPHEIENRHPQIVIPDDAFHNLFQLLGRFSWNLDDAPGGNDDEMRPDVLGYIFEKYINQKAFGAYYTQPEITEYLCEETIHRQLLKRVNCPDLPGKKGFEFDSVEEMLLKPGDELCERILDALPKIKVIDPACGSGAFLVAALKTFINLYSAVYGKALFLQSPRLEKRLQAVNAHPSLEYFIRKTIITQNLYGVDIMDEAVEIARLRLFVSLVACAKKVEDLEPLPNIDFNLMAGNSLVGLLHVEDAGFGIAYQKTGQTLYGKGHVGTYRDAVNQKNRLVHDYKNFVPLLNDPDDDALQKLKQNIENARSAACLALDRLLLENMHNLGVKFEQQSWDENKQSLAKPLKRTLNLHDVQILKPFHWAYEFPDVFENGGFDVVIGNPPWEVLKPQDKEFFEKISSAVSKKSMTIKDFEKEMKTLVQNAEVRQAYLDYLSQFPHQSAYFRAAKQFENQSAIVGGKKTGTDPNLYKLFFEQFYNIANEGGEIGIVVPSGIYSDLGTKGLRDLIFSKTKLHGICSFENNGVFFEGVHRSFKFCLISMSKGGTTESFRAAFMRREPQDVALFRRKKIGLEIPTSLIRRVSPDTLSVPEIKNPLELSIIEKSLKFPFLGAKNPDGSDFVKFNREFDMTNDSYLFETTAGPGKLPLFEGKMMHQFVSDWGEPKYWIDEAKGRAALIGKEKDAGQILPYQRHRICYRAIARGTDSRTLIAAALPKNVFYGHSLNADVSITAGKDILIFLVVFNSFCVDYLIRSMVSSNLTMNFVYQLPVPRLLEGDAHYAELLEGSARLTCVGEGYRDLWAEVFPGRPYPLPPSAKERTEIRADMDARVARIYGLTREEFAYVLSTFPLADEAHKRLALELM